MRNICNLILIAYIWQKSFPFLINRDLLSIFLLVDWFGKVLVKNFRKNILIYYWLIIMVRLCEIEIFISKNIYKSLVDLIWINITLKLSIVFFTTFWTLHKAYISGSIIYDSTSVIHLLVQDIFIKVHIIIWDKKTMKSSLFNSLFYDNYAIDL